MKYRIEEAVIVETIETEPHFKVETVVPEPVDKPRKKPGSFIESIFDLLFSSIGLSSEFGSGFEDDLYPEEELDPVPEPEAAIIVETHERVVQEQYFLIYEVEE